MAKVRDYHKLALDIIDVVGGQKNIVNATRCATRLRLVLKETPEGAKEKVSALAGVITVVENNGQFQVVIGTHVGEVYDSVAKALNLDASTQEIEQPKQSIVNRIIATMSAVFAPFVYILAAAGLLQGVLILITMATPAFAETGTYEILNFMSWTPFTFLPIFIAITASKHFKCNTYIAILCCCALVNQSWADIAARIADGDIVRFLGVKLSETTYTSTVLPPLLLVWVLPPLLLVWVLSYLEHFIEKKLPDAAKPLLTPLICFVIMVPATIIVIGPASAITANAIANGYNALVAFTPALAGAIIGGLWQIFVIFGVHWGITPVVLANFDMNGCDTFQAFQTIAVVAQVAAAFGVFIKSRNKAFKGVALSAGVTGIFGITEPTIYGVTLRLKKPFICGCAGGAIGAVVLSFFHSAYYAYAGLPGLLTIVNAINKDAPMSFIGEALACVIASVITIVAIQIVGFDDPVDGSEEKEEKEEKEIESPLAGTVIPLSEVHDEVFASEMMGKGCAVIPEEGKVYAPFDGKVVGLLDSHHAVGMESTDGVEVLIHVGMDTVKLNGRCFTIHVEEGEQVKKGQLLLEFDIPGIKEAGYEVTTPIIITNSDEFNDVETKAEGKVTVGTKLLELS
nr:beta-glucoside-specific PTS transporter subunit IIABC [uncultured Dorea sp.]